MQCTIGITLQYDFANVFQNDQSNIVPIIQEPQGTFGSQHIATFDDENVDSRTDPYGKSSEDSVPLSIFSKRHVLTMRNNFLISENQVNK